MNDREKTRLAFFSVEEELRRATGKFGPFKSSMEGQAIIAEEFDEFTEAVRHESPSRARAEAIQLAAMSIRYLIDTPIVKDDDV